MTPFVKLALLAVVVQCILLTSVNGYTFNQYQTGGLEDCGYTSFGPCTLKSVFALVQQAVNDFSSAYGQTNPAGVLAVINKGGSQYRAGRLSLQVYTDSLIKVADSADPSTNGWTLEQIFEQKSILTDPHYGDKLRAAATALGSWTYAYVYNWSMPSSPTPQRTWTSSVVVNGTRYSFASTLDNIELGALKESCTANHFTDCSASIAYYLSSKVAMELTELSANSSFNGTSVWSYVSSSPEYKVTGGFDVSVFSSTGELLVEGNAGKGVPSSAWADFAAAATAGGSWVVYNTTTQPVEERQAWVSWASWGGQNYYIFSSISTQETSPCPSCNCPVCEQKECPECFPVSDCDTTEVTKLKFDFEGIA